MYVFKGIALLPFIYSIIYPLTKDLLSACYVPGTVLGACFPVGNDI